MTAAAMPLDAPARETIIGDLDRNLFVEAGAGTGKTTALVARIVRLVATGRLAEIRQLAAITFTEAAAAELRERIRAELERASDPGRGLADPAERLRCRAAASRVDEAVITTLHGFAQRILAEHPVAAGLPPAFEVDEGIPAELEFVERWGAFVDELLADPRLTEGLQIAVTLRLSLDRLGEVARLLHDRWDRLEGIEQPTPADLAPDPSSIVTALRSVVAVHAPYADADDGLVRRITDEVLPVVEAYDAAVATGDPLELLRVLDATVIPGPGNAGQKAVWGDDKAVVVGLLKEAVAAREVLLAELRTQALGRLLPEVVDFTVRWAAERRRAGRLHFHDLLVIARDLLWSDAAVRAALAQRWSVLVIDEFQDTDPLQVELVFALATTDAAQLPGSWEQLELAPGRVLVVGDPKQSIYGFRGADISLWTRAKALFDGGVVHLQQNFRSVDSILGWVNDLFDELIGEGDGDAQPAYTELLPSRTSLEAEPDVVILGGPAPDGMRASEVRSLEAAEIAAAIRTLRSTGDGRRYDDVAILVPTRAPIGAIERALDDADVPYRIESRSLVWRTDVVREILALLTAVEDPADEVAVVAALRSPAFACSDRDLVEWRTAGGRWDHTRRAPEEIPADHPVAAAMRTMAGWHDERHWLTVDALLDRIVADRRLVELTMAQRRPRDHWRRIRFLVDQARAFVEAGGSTLAQFLSWAALQTDEGATAVETVVPEPDDDAVRILTVHGAKGLEFPVVVLAGLSTGKPTAFTNVLWTDDGPELTLLAQGGKGAFATAGFDAAQAGAKRFEEAEAVRLLYVAATRARDQLLVSVHHPSRGARGTHAQLLHERGATNTGTWRPFTLDAPPALFDLPAPGRAPRTEDERARWRERHQAAMAAANERWSVSPTGLGELAGDPHEPHELVDDSAPADPEPVLDDQDPAGTPPPGRRQGPVVGSAVHAVLEHVPLAGTDPVPADVVADLARRAATELGIAGDAATVAELATSALASQALADARAAGRFWREVPVVVPVGSRVLEGFVDLVYERPDGSVVVVDWKTDRGHTSEAVDAALDRYRLQGAGYAAAIGAATGRDVVEVRFVFCRAGGPPVERTIGDLAGAVSEVAALLG